MGAFSDLKTLPVGLLSAQKVVFHPSIGLLTYFGLVSDLLSSCPTTELSGDDDAVSKSSGSSSNSSSSPSRAPPGRNTTSFKMPRWVVSSLRPAVGL